MRSRPVSLFSASNDYLRDVLNGRCDQARLVDGLRDLISLYYQPAETSEMRARQIALFVKDLSDMSDDCVGWAIDEWRRNNDRRPTPASLRQLCMMRREAATKALKPEATNLHPAPCTSLEPLSDEEKAKRQAIIERCAHAAGMIKHQGQWVTPSRHEELTKEQERKPHWSEQALPNDPRWAVLRRARARVINSAPEPF
jgi:hypothetical protein